MNPKKSPLNRLFKDALAERLRALLRRVRSLFENPFLRRAPDQSTEIKKPFQPLDEKVRIAYVQRGKPSEHATQFFAPSQRQLDLVLGLDFGTSSSKVAIRSPFTAGGRAFIVPFGGDGHQSNEFLIPTRVFRNEGEAFHLQPVPNARCVVDLKMPLSEVTTRPSIESNQATRSAQACAAGYLSLVIQKARYWFLANKGEFYGYPSLRWHLHLGIPSAGYDDEPIRRTFLEVARAAWILSLEKSPPTESRACQILEHLRQGGDVPQIIHVKVIPEVVAEVVGYAKSPLRDPGLHLLVDIGASTLDVCSFNLHGREGEDKYALLTADVRRLGVLRLFRSQVGREEGEYPEDLVAPIVGSEISIGHIDREFVNEFRRALMTTLMPLKGKRDPKSLRWKTGLPVFMAGGGSRIKAFREMMDDVDAALQTNMNAKGLRFLQLPKPEAIKDDIPGDAFHLFAVAYGLSHYEFEFGTITAPADIQDVALSGIKRNIEAAYVSKDQV